MRTRGEVYWSLKRKWNFSYQLKFAKHNQLNDFAYKLYMHLENEDSTTT